MKNRSDSTAQERKLLEMVRTEAGLLASRMLNNLAKVERPGQFNKASWRRLRRVLKKLRNGFSG